MGRGLRAWPACIRVEFETGREVLKQVRIDSFEDARDRMPELWAYLTERWLSLREPSQDTTRSRWPIAREWEQVQRASLRGNAIGLDRVAAGSSAGSLRQLLPQLRGYLASTGALIGAESLDDTLHGVARIIRRDEDESGVSFASRLAAKRLGAIA